jgi:hypothetical protein
MAITKGVVANALADTLVTDTTTDSTVEAHVTGAAGSLYYVYIDNTANTAAAYVKIADATSATSGSTVPDFVFYAPASRSVSYAIPSGHAYATGVSFWGTTTQASAVSQTDPGTAITVRILST